MSEVENGSRSSRKRGPYLQYLADQDVKIPKVSKWRRQQRQDNNTHECDGLSLPEENFEEESGSLLDETDEAISLTACEGASGCVNNVYVPAGGDLLDPGDPAISEFHQLYDTFADDEEELNDVQENEDEDDETGFPLDDESDENKPLYPGARLTLASSMLLIITFVIRHSLTGAALTDLLILLELHCISPNLCRKSVDLFRKFFRKLRAPIEFHYYCNRKKCKSYLGRTKLEVCPNCHGSLTGKEEVMYFVVVPILYQLQNLFQEKKFCESIWSYRQTRKKQCADNIEDVMDGDLYKKHFGADNFFRGTKKQQKNKELHISLQINTDGVSLFRSSAFSVWPVYFIVNELHPLIRFKRKYRIFAGLWFGYEKPVFKIFMKPFAESLKDLFHVGTTVKTDQGHDLTVRALLLNGVFDAPARCLFQELVQFNGWFGCPFCLHPGKTVKTSERGSTHTYPFNHENMATGFHEERSHDETLKHAQEADKLLLEGKESTVNGVKGSTWFMFVPGYDIIKGISIDYMHCALLGVTKMLLSLWSDKSYKNEAFYVGNQMDEVNRRLTSIRPPHCITRAPRNLSELSHFKATEFKAFLLFYGAVCMWNILPNEYFQHFLLLVEATYLLLQDSISLADLNKATRLLKHFCINVGALYGERYQTSNVHLLLHLTQKVKDLGPLWSNSCFYFEDFNGELRNLFHGTQKVDMQVTLAVCIQQKIPEMEKSLAYGSSASRFYEHLTGRKACHNNKSFISAGIYSIGKLNNFKTTGSETAAIEKVLGGNISKCFKFKRLELRGDIVQCTDYKRVSRRNSHTVQFHAREGYSYGYVKCYAKVYRRCPNPVFCEEACVCKIPHYLAIVSRLQQSGIQLAQDDVTGATVPHIIPVNKAAAEIMAIEVSDIVKLCVSIRSHSEADFVCHFPNRFEKD